MRLVYFAHFAGGSDAASAMDADLFAAMREQGHEVTVLAPFRDASVGRIRGDIAAGRLPRLLLAIPGYARMLVAGLRLARRDEARIASQYHVFHPATLVAFLAARLRGKPLVAHAHDPLPGSYRSAREGAVYRAAFRLYRRILAHPRTWVLVPSPELRTLAAERLGLRAERIVSVPNNVTAMPPPAPEAVHRLRESLGLQGARVVLQFGSFTPTGATTFVDGLRRLARADVKGLVLADPWRGATFAREAERLSAADRVIVLGIRPYGELNAFLALADVCVGLLSADPTAYGSLPRSTLEAMAAGKPVVLCRGVASATLVEDGVNGLLVPPDDPAAFAAAVESLLSQPHLAANLGARARATVDARFRSDAVALVFATIVEGIH